MIRLHCGAAQPGAVQFQEVIRNQTEVVPSPARNCALAAQKPKRKFQSPPGAVKKFIMSQNRFERQLRLVVLLPIGIALILGSVLLFGVNKFLIAHEGWVTHSDQVIGVAQQLHRAVIDQETSLRAYLLTNDKNFLEPFARGRDETQKVDDELRQLISDNPEEQARNQKASRAYAEWSSWADAVLAMAKAGQDIGGTPAQLRGKELMDQYRAAQIEFVVNEKRLRDEHFASSRKSLLYANLSVVAMCLSIGSVLAAIGRKHLLKSHEELEQRVEERTQELQTKNAELINQTEVVRELSGRLLQTQDEERRRLARDLHDSLGQLVAVLAMNLSLLEREVPRVGQSATRLVTDCLASVQELSSQIRTISHLLHPPLLDEVGLSSALQWYVEEFAQRSNIKVALELSPELGRLTRDAETSIFRVVQECLTNIHRHSGSPTSLVRINCFNGNVRIEVWDAGKGISPEKQSLFNSAGRGGVGVRGMRERLRQFGGTLQVNSGANGTVVIATLASAQTAALAASEQVA